MSLLRPYHLNEHFLELNLDVVDISIIKVKHVAQKGLHLKIIEKDRLALNLIHKTKNATRFNNHDDSFHVSFTLIISVFSEVYT